MTYRKPTSAEAAKAWHDLAFEINLHRTITMNHQAVVHCLERIDKYVGAHGDHNGERGEEAIQNNVNRVFWEHIAKTPAVGLITAETKTKKPRKGA